MSTPEENYTKANEYWNVEKFFTDVALRNDLHSITRKAKLIFKGILLGKTPTEIAEDMHYGGNEPSGTVRKTISQQIRPAVVALCGIDEHEQNFIDYRDIPRLLASKYKIDKHSYTEVSSSKSQTGDGFTQVNKKEISIQFTDVETLKFGSMETTWLVKDGTGERAYRRDNIVCHYDNDTLKLPDEIEKEKQKIAREQKENREKGKTSFWNGSRYCFDRFVITRTSHEENPCLDLWFRPSDYYTFLVTNQRLNKDRAFREKYFQTDWEQPVSLFANSFAAYLSVITQDDYLIITQRGLHVGSRPGELNISANEGLSRDKDHVGGKPDLYNLATRAISEELGVDLPYGYINYLSFGVDIELGHWSLIPAFLTN